MPLRTSRPSSLARLISGIGRLQIPTPLNSFALQAMYPPFAVGAPTAALPGGPAVSEVHLRRLDRDNILHRRAVAEICIDASTEEVCVHRGIAWRRATHCSNAEHRIMEPITSCMCMLTDKHTTKVRMPLVECVTHTLLPSPPQLEFHWLCYPQVWQVLMTAYEALVEVVPAHATSTYVGHPAGSQLFTS